MIINLNKLNIKEPHPNTYHLKKDSNGNMVQDNRGLRNIANNLVPAKVKADIHYDLNVVPKLKPPVSITDKLSSWIKAGAKRTVPAVPINSQKIIKKPSEPFQPIYA